jgi:hypothetical protein
MLLTVKKQVEETVEFETPVYYKDWIGNFHHINETGQLTTVRQKMINMWEPEHTTHYTEAIEEILRRGEPCTKEEFEKAYLDVLKKFENATSVAF